jgi:hypothetical protein
MWMMETNEDSTINVVFSIIVGDRREADMTLCCLCCCTCTYQMCSEVSLSSEFSIPKASDSTGLKFSSISYSTLCIPNRCMYETQHG